MGIIKYSKAHYEKKISIMEEYAAQLDGHIQNLETLKEKLKNIWDDENGLAYYTEINKLIQSCKNANNQIRRMRVIWMNSSEDMTKTEELITETADLLKAKVSALSIEGDS